LAAKALNMRHLPGFGPELHFRAAVDSEHRRQSPPLLVNNLRAVTMLMAALASGAPAARAADLHAPFSSALARHVADGRVDYGGMARDADFARYLELLSGTDVGRLAGDADRLAFWINTYNALAIKGILDGRSPSGVLGRIGFFRTATWSAGGLEFSLHDLEHRILLPLGDPRVHFAIVCASRSCPKLRAEAYRAADLERQLDEAAVSFINDPDRNRFDRETGVAHLSKIFDWFAADFRTHAGSVQKYLARYVADPAVAGRLAQDGFRVRHLPYDWSLNGIR
jgi:hypothetical protein